MLKAALELIHNAVKHIEEKRYHGGEIDYPGVGLITDKEVAAYARKHLHWYDRFDVRKTVEAGLMSQCILMGVITPEEVDLNNALNKKWYF